MVSKFLPAIMSTKGYIELKVNIANVLILMAALSILFSAFYLVGMGLVKGISKDYAELYSFETASYFNSQLIENINKLEDTIGDKAILAWFADEQDEDKKKKAFTAMHKHAQNLSTGILYFGIAASGGEFTFDKETKYEDFRPFTLLEKGNPQDGWYFEAAASPHNYVLNVDKDKILGRTLVWVNHKVLDENGVLLGIIATGIALDKVLYSAFDAYNVSFLRGIIVDSQGLVQMDSDMDDTELVDESSIRIEEVFPEPELHTFLNPYLASISTYFFVTKQPAIVELPSSSGYHYAAIAAIERTDWLVITLFNANSLFSLAEFSPLLWPAIFLLTVFALIICFVGHRYMFKPLAKMVQSVAATSHVPIEYMYVEQTEIYGIERKDELGTLAKTIQCLRESLGNKHRELSSAAVKAEAANKAKSNFLGHMSHEMRTPMNVIIGMANIAKESQDLEKIRESLGKIEVSSTHLLNIINNVLDMSKIEANKVSLQYAPFHFVNMLQRVAFELEGAEWDFSMDVDKDIPAYIISDEQRMEQVIFHFLSNAKKFTPAGGRILLQAELLNKSEEQCFLKISITDTGIGVAEEQQEYLFQPFQQANMTISHKFGGAGLGLSICKQVVDLMEGELFFDSVENKGTCIGFVLACDLPDADFVATSEKIDVVDDISLLDLRNKTILLVDDVDINREIAMSMFENTGVKFVEAENGAVAVQKISANIDLYDVVLMDIQMPEMDGYEATKAIRRLHSPKAKTIPIIAMTANTFREDALACLEAGMNDHVGKPIDTKELLTVLKKFIG